MIDCLIVNFNDAATVEECISKLEKYPSVRKIIIVDNCSTDNSVAKLKRCTSKKIELIVNHHNGGYGFGNNIGIRYLKKNYQSRYVLLCNPDTYIDEVTILKMQKFLEERADYAIVAPVMLNSTRQPQINTAIKLPSSLFYSLSLEILFSKLFNPMFYSKFSNEKIMQVGCVSGSLFLLNVDIIYKYALFDENIFLYNEEIVLGKKLDKAGYKVGLFTEETFIHNHSVSISKTYDKLADRQRLLIKSHKYVVRTYFHCNFFERVIDNICCAISLLEHILIAFIKKEM